MDYWLNPIKYRVCLLIYVSISNKLLWQKRSHIINLLCSFKTWINLYISFTTMDSETFLAQDQIFFSIKVTEHFQKWFHYHQHVRLNGSNMFIPDMKATPAIWMNSLATGRQGCDFNFVISQGFLPFPVKVSFGECHKISMLINLAWFE